MFEQYRKIILIKNVARSRPTSQIGVPASIIRNSTFDCEINQLDWRINWEIEMNKAIVFSEGLFPPGKLWSHTPTNQTKQSSSGSCHLNSGFEQLINKAGQNLTPVTYTLDSYVLLLVCALHLKKLEKSGKLDQWCLKNSIYSLWRDCHVWDRCNNTRIFDQIISGTL